jgi:hypothetical protein
MSQFFTLEEDNSGRENDSQEEEDVLEHMEAEDAANLLDSMDTTPPAVDAPVQEEEQGPPSPTNAPARPLNVQEATESEEPTLKIIELDESAFKSLYPPEDDVMSVEEVDELDEEELPNDSSNDHRMADVSKDIAPQESTLPIETHSPQKSPARQPARTPSPIRVPRPFATSTPMAPTHTTLNLPDLTGSLSKLLGLTRLSMDHLPQLLATQKSSLEFTQLVQKLDSVLYPPKSEPESIPSLRAHIETLKAEKVVLQTDIGGVSVATLYEIFFKSSIYGHHKQRKKPISLKLNIIAPFNKSKTCKRNWKHLANKASLWVYSFGTVIQD